MNVLLRQGSILLLLGAVGGVRLPPIVAQDSSAGPVASIIRTARVPWARYAEAVTRLYDLNSERPLWLEDLRVSRSGHAAIRALLQAEVHGLDPAD
jgi:hypothetical protein